MWTLLVVQDAAGGQGLTLEQVISGYFLKIGIQRVVLNYRLRSKSDGGGVASPR